MNRYNQKGFTLIELTLAMGFVSALLLAIALTTIQIGNTYTRGITLKNVSQAGSSLASELQRSIDQSTPFDVTLPNTNSYVVQKSGNVLIGGRLCIGQYSYIWNYGLANIKPNLYDNPNSKTQLNFVKVFDPHSDYCKKIPPNNTYKPVDLNAAVELIDVGQSDLALQSFVINSAASDPRTNQQLYNIEFQLGSNDQNALTTDQAGIVSCKPPGVAGSDPARCSVNQFNIVALAGNAVE